MIDPQGIKTHRLDLFQVGCQPGLFGEGLSIQAWTKGAVADAPELDSAASGDGLCPKKLPARKNGAGEVNFGAGRHEP